MLFHNFLSSFEEKKKDARIGSTTIHDASAYSIASILRERLRNQVCAVHRQCFLNPAIQCAMAGARIGSTTKTFESERFFMYDELPDE